MGILDTDEMMGQSRTTMRVGAKNSFFSTTRQGGDVLRRNNLKSDW